MTIDSYYVSMTVLRSEEKSAKCKSHKFILTAYAAVCYSVGWSCMFLATLPKLLGNLEQEYLY